MTKEGELHADEDRRHKEEVETKNRADSLVYSVEKMLKENREKISENDAKNIESALDDAKKAIQEGDISKINASVERLTTASHKLAEAMYKQAASEKQPPQAPGSAPGASGPAGGTADTSGKSKGDGEVIDAEVVDNDDQKNAPDLAARIARADQALRQRMHWAMENLPRISTADKQLDDLYYRCILSVLDAMGSGKFHHPALLRRGYVAGHDCLGHVLCLRVAFHVGSRRAAGDLPDVHSPGAADPHLYSLERQGRTLCLRAGPLRQDGDLAGLSPPNGRFRLPRPRGRRRERL